MYCVAHNFKEEKYMENRFTNFNKAKEEVKGSDYKTEVVMEEEKKKHILLLYCRLKDRC